MGRFDLLRSGERLNLAGKKAVGAMPFAHTRMVAVQEKAIDGSDQPTYVVFMS